MLTSLGLANFKSLGPALQTVPLKPLTLVFGPNSSGKSSLIHSLLLLHHAATSRDADLTGQRTALGGDSVDLGGFWQYLHGRGRKEGEVQIACDFTRYSYRFRSQFLRSAKSLRLELTISSRNRTEAPRLSVCRALVDGAPLYQIVQPAPGTARLNTWETDHPLSRSIMETCLQMTPRVTAGDETTRAFREAIYELLDTLTLRTGDGLLPYEFEAPAQDEKPRMTVAEVLEDRNPYADLKRAVDLYFERTATDILRDFRDLFTASLNRVEYLGPLRKLPRRHLADDDLLSDRASGAYAWKVVMEDEDVRDRVNQWLGADFLQTRYRLEVRDLVHVDEPSALEAIRKEIEESLVRLALGEDKFGETLLGDWIDDHHADIAGDLRERIERLHEEFKELPATQKLALLDRNPDLLEKVIELEEQVFRDQIANGDDEDDGEVHDEAWVVRQARERGADAVMIFDHYQVELFKRFVSESGELQQALGELAASELRAKSTAKSIIQADHDRRSDLRLIDLRANTAVTHRDVGVGISQVLPVLVHAYADVEKVVAIEQPEIHIHPALQAELADVFIESAFVRGNKFIIETHSEHLILRLLRRIRETTEGEVNYLFALKPSDIAVLYVEPGENGAKVIEIPVGPDGDFDRPWPNGFFSERGKELF